MCLEVRGVWWQGVCVEVSVGGGWEISPQGEGWEIDQALG